MLRSFMDRNALDRWCERGILALVLAVLVFGPLALGAVDTLPFLIIQGLTAGVMLLWAARFWLAPKAQLLWPPICWVVVAFTLYAIIRYLQADIEYVARQELLRILVYAFLFLAVINNLRRQESAQIVSFTLVFLAMAISFYALYQFLTGSVRVWQYVTPYKHRGTGTYICPNHLAGFLEMLLPLGLAYALAGRLKPVTRVLLGYAALVVLAGIAVTVSRGGWASTTVALAVFFGVLLFHHAYRLPAALLLVALVGAGVYFVPKSFNFQSRLKSLGQEQSHLDEDTRLALWGPAIEIWQQNPWWGAGPAHFDDRFRAYRPETVQLTPYRAHNDFLNALADWGVVGAALVASAWVLLGLGVLKIWRVLRGGHGDLGGKPGSNRFAFVLGASLGLLAILCHSVVDFNMHIPANAILAVVLMALLSGHLRFATERYWVSARVALKALASIVLLAGVGYLGHQGWRRATEDFWLERAAAAADFSPEKVGLLKKAFGVEPMNAQTAYSIGEALERQSREGGGHYEGMGETDYRQLAEEAMTWFERSAKLNPWHAYSPLHYGMCLDWLGRFDKSAPYFDRAERLDPNGYFTLDHIGMHYVELENFAAAKPWFERSLRLENQFNPIARNYLEIVQGRLMEAATNEISSKLSLPAP
jgi:O-antigen ligase